jgi:hypothetical protein
VKPDHDRKVSSLERRPYVEIKTVLGDLKVLTPPHKARHMPLLITAGSKAICYERLVPGNRRLRWLPTEFIDRWGRVRYAAVHGDIRVVR